MGGQTIVVAGGTGATGRRVVTRCLEAGRAVRVLSRSAARAHELLGSDVEVFEGDVREEGSLEGLGRDVSAVVCTMGTRTYFGANGGHAVDALGTDHLVRALGAEGSPHLVLLSAFGLDRSSLFLSGFSAVLGGYFTHKAAAEATVRRSGLPYTIVRPVELRDRAPRRGPLLNQSEPLSLLRTVSRDLVADVLVRCVDTSEARGRTFELCEGGEEPVEAQLSRMMADGERPLPPRTPLF